MASVKNTTTITWDSGSTSKSHTSGRVDSDVISLNVEDWDGSFSVKATNSGTPTAGDYLDVYAKWSTDGTNYDTDKHAEFLCRIDVSNVGESPGQRTIDVSVSGKKAVKLSCVAAQGGTRAVTVAGSLTTHRPQ